MKIPKAYIEAEIQVAGRNIEEATGLPVVSMVIEKCEKVRPIGINDKVDILETFKIVGYPGTFSVVGLSDENETGESHYATLILSDGGYQLYPNDLASSAQVRTKEIAEASYWEHFVVPFLVAMSSRMTPERYVAFIESCDRMNGRGKP